MDCKSVYETGLLYHHYANTAYPLTPSSFMQYKLRDEAQIRSFVEKMEKSLLDKLFFMDKLFDSVESIVDLWYRRCLVKFLRSTRPFIRNIIRFLISNSRFKRTAALF